jgi:hypothetical protein
MGRFKFLKARNFKDYWIINELVEHCNEEGKDGRFRWCYTGSERITLPYIEEGQEAKLMVTMDRFPKVVGFYSYDSQELRLDVMYVVPKMRGSHVGLDMVNDFRRMFPRERELYVLNPGRAVRKMLNKYHPGKFCAVVTERGSMLRTHYDEEDLVAANG